MTVVGIKGDKVIVRLDTIGKEVAIHKGDELRPFNEAQVSKDARVILKANGKGGKPKAKKTNALSAFIDPYLLAGGKTTQEIAADVAKKAGEAGKGRDIAANVRARMVSYTRKGWQVVKDEKKRVKVVQKKA